MTRSTNTSITKQPHVSLVLAFSGMRQFLLQPFEDQTIELLLLTKEIRSSGDKIILGNIALDPITDPAIISFDIIDDHGETVRFRCNPFCFAFLILIVACGLNVFANRGREGGKPYLKALVRGDEKARIVLARAFAGAEGAEDEDAGTEVRYKDRDPCNLTHSNLTLNESRRVKTGTLAWVEAVLAHAPRIADALVPGTKEEKYQVAQRLFTLAMDRMSDERDHLKPKWTA